MIEKITQLMEEAVQNDDNIKYNTLRYLKRLLEDNSILAHPRSELEVMVKYARQIKANMFLNPQGSSQYVRSSKELDVLQTMMPGPLEECEINCALNIIQESIENPNIDEIMNDLSPRIRGEELPKYQSPPPLP